ncbi:hypothetical protein DCS_00054 [Drechmeria coniospora]|uniref:Uncharacterized protein n=1 Tax=Drechmeria coniospora TaxID=98403 RepID=A0A151GP97_DRECN|nr:hypothetical protein DCS_00054 [Drechmeria coniospora]KYK58927.1 hypothetical protein DCS_00054 [Drechmeria coniospora]
MLVSSSRMPRWPLSPPTKTLGREWRGDEVQADEGRRTHHLVGSPTARRACSWLVGPGGSYRRRFAHGHRRTHRRTTAALHGRGYLEHNTGAPCFGAAQMHARVPLCDALKYSPGTRARGGTNQALVGHPTPRHGRNARNAGNAEEMQFVILAHPCKHLQAHRQYGTPTPTKHIIYKV